MRKVLHAFGLLPAARRGRAAINEAVENWKYRVQSFRLRREAAGFAIPPRKLNLMVTGTEDPEWYARGGWLAAQSIRFALERNAISVEGLTSILDFGCGAGRVIRHWAKLSALVHGTDYNPELIRCAQHLRFAEFRVNGLQPPLGYPSNSFDLVYALSVFTHLDEAGQFAWINELRRVVKPGGYLLITTHGMCPFYLKHLNQAEQEQQAGGKEHKSQDLVEALGFGWREKLHPAGGREKARAITRIPKMMR